MVCVHRTRDLSAELDLQAVIGATLGTTLADSLQMPAQPRMRVRIIRLPPVSYGVDGDSLRVGRVYNLDASLASALLADGCAEMFDLLSSEDRQSTHTEVWRAHEKPLSRRIAPSTSPDGKGEPEQN